MWSGTSPELERTWRRKWDDTRRADPWASLRLNISDPDGWEREVGSE